MAKISKKAAKLVAALPQAKKAVIKTAAKRAAKVKKSDAPAKVGELGRAGTSAEAYKKFIMSGLSNAECHAAVAKALGTKAAGPKTNAPWYRWQLKKNGVKGVPGSKRAKK